MALAVYSLGRSIRKGIDVIYIYTYIYIYIYMNEMFLIYTFIHIYLYMHIDMQY